MEMVDLSRPNRWSDDGEGIRDVAPQRAWSDVLHARRVRAAMEAKTGITALPRRSLPWNSKAILQRVANGDGYCRACL